MKISEVRIYRKSQDAKIPQTTCCYGTFDVKDKININTQLNVLFNTLQNI